MTEPLRPPSAVVRGAIAGTPPYIAPELLWGERFDGRADQYAVATMALDLLFGLGDRERRATSEVPRHPRDARAVSARTLPTALDLVVARAGRLDPDARWPDIDAFADALEPWATVALTA